MRIPTPPFSLSGSLYQHLQNKDVTILETSLACRWERVMLPSRASGKSPDLPEFPQTSPEVPPRLLWNFSHCGFSEQSRGSPEVSPDLSGSSKFLGPPQRSAPFLWEAGHHLITHNLDGQNRQSPIASVQRTQSTLASQSAVPCGTNVKRMNANRAIRTAGQRTQGL